MRGKLEVRVSGSKLLVSDIVKVVFLGWWGYYLVVRRACNDKRKQGCRTTGQ
jgi:hypothetical protein